MTLTWNDINVLIDGEDYLRVTQYTWWVNAYGYWMCKPEVGRNNERLYLARFILNYDGPLVVDHIDRNPNNNQKSNLRIATRSVNAMNSKLRTTNTSGVAGVRFVKHRGKWQARIKIDYQEKSLGYFLTFEEAVQARKTAEESYWAANKKA